VPDGLGVLDARINSVSFRLCISPSLRCIYVVQCSAAREVSCASPYPTLPYPPLPYPNLPYASHPTLRRQVTFSSAPVHTTY
jgi:hypothetical protein